MNGMNSHRLVAIFGRIASLAALRDFWEIAPLGA